MSQVNLGVCEKCNKRVPAEHVVTDGRVLLRKNCPDCGPTDAIVSSIPERWQRKRELYQYSAADYSGVCSMRCDACGRQHVPRMLFVDLTNRCNMNCPICIANVQGMGFEFDPPLAYFRRVLEGVARMNPKPVVHLFGGEPTVREDLFEIIDIAHKLGLRVHLNTNGLKLEDENYCRRVCETGVSVLFSCDGTMPEIDRKMRGLPSVCERRMKALENLKKHSTGRRNIIMCVVARNINDDHIADMFKLAHDHRSHIKGLYFLPLTETWQKGRFEADVRTTMEDTEEIVDAAFQGETVTYLSLGLQHHLNKALAVFGAGSSQTFPDIHPNCESGTQFYSDGERYHPLGYFLKRPLDEVAEEAVKLAKKIEPRLTALEKAGKLDSFGARLLVLRTFGGLLRRSLNFRRVMKGNPALAVARIVRGLLARKNMRDLLKKHSYLSDSLASIILPFEEPHSLESERLEKCSAGFAYEDPATGEVRHLPVCTWSLYKTDIMKGISGKYGTVRQPKA